MRKRWWLIFMAAFTVLVSCRIDTWASAAPADAQNAWTSDFGVDRSDLSDTGRNPYFILEPGYQLWLEHGKAQLTITVLDDVRTIDGTRTRVVEERETNDGRIVEVSRNFFAISTRTNSVFYFGEEVDNYKDGRVANHSGSWIAGENGATFGLAMPGEPLLKARYYQEMAPKVAMDRAEIVSMHESVKTPSRVFSGCLAVRETTPLEVLSKEYKYYVRGIGIVQDGSLTIVRYGTRDKSHEWDRQP